MAPSQTPGGDLTAGGSTLPEPRAWRAALMVALAAGAVRLLIGALTPPFPDETYYWEWSRHLSAGYFDHPPLIAWAIRGGTLLLGDTTAGVRFVPIVLGVLGTLLLAGASRRIAGDRGALLTAVVFSVMPLSAAGLILATPDAPLLAAASGVVYAVVRALELAPGTRASLRWWCVAGVALGLALTAKYTAVLLPFGLVVAFALRRDLRPRLREAGPYVAIALSLLVFAPVIAWNARHEWVSFAFQLRHGLGSVGGSVVGRELELIGGQLGLVTPILFGLLGITVARALRRNRSATEGALAITAVVVFLFFAYSATKRRAEANWPALAYVPALLLLTSEGSRAWRRWLAAGVVLAAALTLVTYVNAFTPVLPVPARRDPAARAHGWNDLALAIERIRVNHRRLSRPVPWIAADRYQDASELAFLLPDRPTTFSLNISGRRNHYDFWPGFPDRARPGDDLLVVLDAVPGVHPTLALLAPHFDQVSGGDVVLLARDADPVKHMRIWVLQRWRGTWPRAPLR